MPETQTEPMLKFYQLSDDAKESARNDYRVNGLDHEWWESVYDDFEQIAEIIGIEIPRKNGRLAIYFSGFWSQGDGAQFEGHYRYNRDAAKEIRNYAPKDQKLIEIVDNLCCVQRKYFYGVSVTIEHRGYYCHEFANWIEVYSDHNNMCQDDIDEVIDQLRNLMRWLYAQLRDEYDYLTSDEAINEALETDFFNADGSLA